MIGHENQLMITAMSLLGNQHPEQANNALTFGPSQSPRDEGGLGFMEEMLKPLLVSRSLRKTVRTMSVKPHQYPPDWEPQSTLRSS